MLGKDTNDRMQTFIFSLKNETKKNKIRLACKAEIKRLTGKFAATTVRTTLTSYRKLSNQVNPLLVKYLKISYVKQKSIKSKYSTKIRKTQNKLSPIINHTEMIKQAIALLSSTSPLKVACALCFLIGRRSTEILKTAKLEIVENSDYELYFKGQLKKNKKGLEYVEFPEYKIYCLGNSANKCIKALKFIRSKVKAKDLTIDKTKARFGGTVNLWAFRSFNSFLGNCTSHDLRKAYGAICAHFYRPNNQTPNAFLSQILGHNQNDITTSNSYQKYYINL